MHFKELVDINLDTNTRRQRLKRRLLQVFVPIGGVLIIVAAILSISMLGYYKNRREALTLSEDILDASDRLHS